MPFTTVNLRMNIGGKKLKPVADCTGWTYCNPGGSTWCGTGTSDKCSGSTTCYGSSCSNGTSNKLGPGLDARVSVDPAQLKELHVALKSVLRGFTDLKQLRTK